MAIVGRSTSKDERKQVQIRGTGISHIQSGVLVKLKLPVIVVARYISKKIQVLVVAAEEMLVVLVFRVIVTANRLNKEVLAADTDRRQ